MKEKPRRHIRLWVALVLIVTVLLSVITTAIILTYRFSLKQRYEEELRLQLSKGLEQLLAEDFSLEAAERLVESGVRVLLVGEGDGKPLYYSVDAPMIPWQKLEEGGGDGPGGGGGPEPDRDEPRALTELVNATLGSADGRFFINDSGLFGKANRSLESTALLLCGRERNVLFCLLLPVESTNAAISLAIRYATVVTVVAWFFCLLLLYWMSKLTTRRHRRIGEIAVKIAELDFSQRCPPALTTELDELSQSVNSMADSLQESIAALQGANEQLQVELAERTRQQQITADLIANLTHDLKTPIAIISGYADGLREGVARTPEKQQTYCEMILRESERMQSIVSQLLSLSRMESGETPIRIEDFDLIPLLDEIRGSFQRELEREGIVPERPDWPETCMVRTDYACARQSLLNYLQNALYHINGGSRIEVRLEDRGDVVRVRVTNSSAPIPEAEAAKLWDKLYRGDISRQRSHGEMGLGLAIVKSNMERLGHAYGFENDPDFPGVSFWLELPKAPNPGQLPDRTRKDG